MARPAPVGGPSSRRGELLDQARAEPCSADVPLENVDDAIHSITRRTPPAPRFPGTRRPAPLRAPRSETGFALPVPDGMLLVTAVRLRIPAEGDLAIGSYTTWPITSVGAVFGAWLVRAEAWLDAWTGHHSPASDED